MEFALGLVAGIALSVLVAVIVIALQAPVTTFTRPYIKAVENAGPRSRGFVMEPASEAEIAREEHIQRNAEAGKDTRIEELM